MVDSERVIRLLDRIAEDVRKLNRYHEQADSLLSDETALNAVKYLFITAIEGCGRVAQHIIASEDWPVAETNADAVRRLGTEQVLIDASAEAVARAVGFRNVLVHQYTEVRNDRVLANLERLADLSDFVGQVARWIDDQP